MHPAEIALESGAPDHRLDIALDKIERQNWRIGQNRFDHFRWIGFGIGSVDPVAGNVEIYLAANSCGGLVAMSNVGLNVVAERKAAPLDPSESAEQNNPLNSKRCFVRSIERGSDALWLRGEFRDVTPEPGALPSDIGAVEIG